MEDAGSSAEGVLPSETGLSSTLPLNSSCCFPHDLAGLNRQLHPPGAKDKDCLGFYGKASLFMWVEAIKVVQQMLEG